MYAFTIEKSWPIHYKKGPSNFSDMGPWAHTLLFLGNTLLYKNIPFILMFRQEMILDQVDGKAVPRYLIYDIIKFEVSHK